MFRYRFFSSIVDFGSFFFLFLLLIMIDFQHYFIDEFESLLVKSSFQKWMNNLRPFLIFMTRTYEFFLVFFFLSYIDSVFNFHWYRVSGKSRLFCQFFGNVSFTWLLKVLPVSVSLGKLPIGFRISSFELAVWWFHIRISEKKKKRKWVFHFTSDSWWV